MIVDVSNWAPDQSFDECLATCVKLGLVEVLEQEGEERACLTQRGVNAMLVLTMIAGAAQKKDAKQPH